MNFQTTFSSASMVEGCTNRNFLLLCGSLVFKFTRGLRPLDQRIYHSCFKGHMTSILEYLLFMDIVSVMLFVRNRNFSCRSKNMSKGTSKFWVICWPISCILPFWLLGFYCFYSFHVLYSSSLVCLQQLFHWKLSILWTCYICFIRLHIYLSGNMVDAFRMHIMQTKELGTCPVRQIGNCSFLYMRISNVYIVIVVSSNANVACAFKFVVEVLGISLPLILSFSLWLFFFVRLCSLKY